MARMNRGMLIASLLMLISMVLTACNQPYSQAPAVTFTPVPQNNLFASAVPTNMGEVQAFATGSAIAQMTTSPGAPVISTATLAPGVTPLATNTPIVSISPTATATLAVVPNAPSATPGVNPGEYILRDGEWPYCIARRFNVDPEALLAASGLTSPDIYYAGLRLKIPQGPAFPGSRVLIPHPTTYTVLSGDTIYGIACKIGEVSPESIASANGISVSTNLTAGQKLSIP